MRRHYASYFRGFDNIRETRHKLVNSENINELYDIIEDIRVKYATSNIES
jgi:tRNA-dihydrouridine synthase